MKQLTIRKIKEEVKMHLDQNRYEHTLGVMYTAGALAMRWISVWREPYLIESKKFICIISKHQVSIMNGVECPPHNSNLHIISSFMIH